MHASFDDLSISWRRTLGEVTRRTNRDSVWIGAFLDRAEWRTLPPNSARWPPHKTFRMVDYLELIMGTAGAVHGTTSPSGISSFLFSWSHAAHHERPVVAAAEELRTFVDALEQRRELISEADWAWLKVTTGEAREAPPAHQTDRLKKRVLKQWRRELDETLHLSAELPNAVSVLLSPRADTASPEFAATKNWLETERVAVRVSAAHTCTASLVSDLRTPVQGVVLGRPESDELPVPHLTVWQRAHELLFQHLALTERCAAFVVLEPNLHALTHLFLALDAARRQERRLPPVVLVGTQHFEPIFDALAPVWGENPRDQLSELGVQITDDPAELDLDLRPARTLSPSAKTTFARGDDLIGSPRMRMLTPRGPRLAQWMHGEVCPPHTFVRNLDAEDNGAATSLSKRARKATEAREIARNTISFALQHFSKREIEAFIRHGAGKEAFAFLYFAAPYSAYGVVLDAAFKLLKRWDERAESAFEKLNILARSSHLKNPDALKSWIVGMGTADVAAEGFATMLNDAVDLVEAGHVIWVERAPGGLGDIVDETAMVAYQHKRVAGKTLTTHVKKAALQLQGNPRTPGTPDGYRGVAQIDVRNNRSYNRLPVNELARVVSEVRRDVPTLAEPRLHELQVLLDDQLLRFDAQFQLSDILPYKQGARHRRPRA